VSRDPLHRGVLLPTDLADRLRTAAEATGEPMRSIAARAIDGHVDALMVRWDSLSEHERALIRAANREHQAAKGSHRRNKGGRVNGRRDSRGRYINANG
jgi:hypothetical protein